MLRQEDLQIDIGRCDGGSFIKVTHVPTGVTRMKGPLNGESSHRIQKRFLEEIEQELVERGLMQYIVADYRKAKGEL